ncbi:ATP-dependent 6-phosphofructokinase [Methanocella sp. CWC-04]|uniref:6-phosphofructokinase n=1 Tax=Methanooceanicella nereidis TaxID=2052831 RepID=A0AAP2W5B4_9EURY|nr:ATP-dependent 6-phosphofructokinase [Methanocella sp. CWC-04]MCD1294148.1 ATP-dependent 6-phosphofructokinase [Methanocella sp. CWC-04]
MKNIGIVTSGGDAPGMNAAIRAVVRVAHSKDLKVTGFKKGWHGLIRNDCMVLTPRSVSGIIQHGGTILHTSRCPEFNTEEGVEKGCESLASNNIDGLVVIGGDGSFRAALELGNKSGVPMIGIPATIDNDVFGTDETIGFDTAVNTAVQQIDKIRDTAVSHDRIFVVEVMGRKRGFLASTVGITVGAEIILVPEVEFIAENVFEIIRENAEKGKKSGIIVAAEGIGDTHQLTKDIRENTGLETRLSILGYAQRGGNPTARSRLLASLFGNRSVELLFEGQGNKAVVFQNGSVKSIDIKDSCEGEKRLDLSLIRLAEILAK